MFVLLCQVGFEDNNTRIEGRATSSIVQENVTEGKNALKVVFPKSEDASDIYFRNPVTFSGEKLLIDVFNPSTNVEYFLIKLYSKEEAYLVSNIWVWPGQNTVEVDLKKLKNRTLLLIKLYTEKPLTLFFDNFRVGVPTYTPKEIKFSPPLTDSNNLVVNGDFELGLKGWKAWSWDGDYRQISGEPVSGSYSCGLKVIEKGAGGIFSDYFRVPKGKYTFSFYVKGPGYYRWSLSSPTPTLKNHYIDKKTIGPGWQQVTQQVEVTDNSDVMVYFFNYGDTDLLFDAVELKRPYGVKIVGKTFQVDGENFFPYAVYGGTAKQAYELGFNTFQPYAVANNLILEDAKYYNIKVLYELSGLIRVGGYPKLEELPNHPSILGWYFDEPDHPKYPTSPTQLRYVTELLRPTNKPTIGCVMSWADSNPYQYGTSVNAIGANIYPFEYKGIYSYEASIKNLLGAASGPAIVVTESNTKATEAQQSYLLYAPIVWGANGLFVWEFNSITENFKKASREIGRLTDRLADFHVQIPGYAACIKIGPNRSTLILVNPTDKDLQVNLDVNQKVSRDFFTGVETPKISTLVEPWGRRVYELKF